MTGKSGAWLGVCGVCGWQGRLHRLQRRGAHAFAVPLLAAPAAAFGVDDAGAAAAAAWVLLGHVNSDVKADPSGAGHV